MTQIASSPNRWRRREASEQARRRDVNECIEGSIQGTEGRAAHSFSCECGDPRCDTTVCATIKEYESVRQRPNRFLIGLNHENPEVECVVSESERFAVVETLAGEASKIALRTDPRSLHGPEWN